MPSDGIPNTQCVHIFEGELKQLTSRLDSPIGRDGLSCYLFGLWTHSSNIVVYLIVSCGEELGWAEKHQLDCVGYVAKEYTEHLYEIAKMQTCKSLSARRQHVIVDVSDTKTSGSLQAFGSHLELLRREEFVYNPQRRLQVNILKNESPFRKEAPVKAEINGHQIEIESISNSGDKERRHAKEINKTHSGNPDAEREHRNGSNIESENGSSRGNHMNGYREAKITQSSSMVRSIKHKLKSEFGVQDENIQTKELSDKLELKFDHNREGWKIDLKCRESGEYFVEISSLSSQKAFSGEFYQSDVVVNEIKRLCDEMM